MHIKRRFQLVVCWLQVVLSAAFSPPPTSAAAASSGSHSKLAAQSLSPRSTPAGISATHASASDSSGEASPVGARMSVRRLTRDDAFACARFLSPAALYSGAAAQLVYKVVENDGMVLDEEEWFADGDDWAATRALISMQVSGGSGQGRARVLGFRPEACVQPCMKANGIPTAPNRASLN
jgi:hypothetical protein